MRYIRTKTFITELEDWMEVDDETLKIGGVKYKIIAQADNIEELVDDFVCAQTILRSKSDVCIATGFEAKIPDVYGVIWTNKGLIYVAKTNDKGELELL